MTTGTYEALMALKAQMRKTLETIESEMIYGEKDMVRENALEATYEVLTSNYSDLLDEIRRFVLLERK